MEQQKLNDAIAKINQLYISTRKKYIVQTSETYMTLNGYESDRVWTFKDQLIKRHLEGRNTYGVFNANNYNKFITFDVDFADDAGMARWATYKVIDALQNYYNVPSRDIHVSFSGNKGYHVDLFFDKNITLTDARRFYEMVLITVDLPPNRVEFRPSFSQAVKLPLGIHQKTGSRCWFVDRETLEPIESFDYLDDVEPMDHSVILDALIELTDEQQAEFQRVAEQTNTQVNVATVERSYAKVTQILDGRRLLYPNTRHEVTLLLASFFNSQGYERDEAVMHIMSVLENTPPSYFSEGSKPEFWRKEATRLVDLAFDNDYRLGNDDRPLTLYKSEMLAVLSVGTFRQKQLAYAMLITSKRYGSTFYLTVNTGMQMLGTKSRSLVQTAIQKLIDVEFIECVARGEIDAVKSTATGHAYYKPNKYRLLIDKPQADEQSVEVGANQQLVDIAYLLFDRAELRRVIKRTEFTNRWSR